MKPSLTQLNKGIIAGILWMYSGKQIDDLIDDIEELYKEKR